jgi:hypothetical protein
VEGADRHDFDRLLVDFLLTAGRDREAMQLLERVSGRDPDDVRSLIDKAEYSLIWLNQPEEALRCIELVLPRVFRAGVFRRKALNTKASILQELGQGDQLSQVLAEIMSLEIAKDAQDVGRERDFVDRAPPGLIAEDVLARYNKFCPKPPDSATPNGSSNTSPEAAKNDASGSPGQKLEKAKEDIPDDYVKVIYPVEQSP